MARLLLAVPLLLSLLSLVHCYYTKTGADCNSMPFLPGHNLVGEGYDIVTRKRKGAYLIDMRTFMTPNGTCHVVRNPFQGNQEQKLPLSAVDLRPITGCRFNFYQSRQSSVSNLISGLMDQDTSDWKVGLPFNLFENMEVGGTRSREYNFATTRVKEDKFTFSIHRYSCTHYRYRVSDTPPLSAEFKKDLSRLPSSYNALNKIQYRRFIDTYGTHYVREASLGGQFRRVTAVRSCLASMNGFSSTKAHNCLTLGFRVAVGEDGSSPSHMSCRNFLQNNNLATSDQIQMHLHHTEVTGGSGWSGDLSLLFNNSGFNTWLQSLKNHPDIVHYSLRLMSDLVPDPDKRSQVKAAIEDYLKENRISKSDEKVSDCPEEKMIGYLTVNINRAEGLKGDIMNPTDGYVTVQYGSYYSRTRVIESDNPVWNERFDLGKVETHLNMAIEVWNENPWFDDLLIGCPEYLKQGSRSTKCWNFFGTVHYSYNLRCYSHLTGDQCERYKPNP